MAELIIDLRKLAHNIRYVCKLCEQSNLELLGVVKACHTFSPVIRAFQENGIRTLGISRISVLRDLLPCLDHPPVLISLPSPSDAKIVTRYFHASFNSELAVIQALAQAADQNGRDHGIILMVDIGDLREGVMPEEVLGTVRGILEIRTRHLRFLGLGTNLACCNGILPDERNLLLLQTLALDIEKHLGHEVETISVGGSVMLDWMADYTLPPKIRQIRMGEAILLGNIPAVNKKHPDLSDDALIFRGEILEIREKPSMPSGRQGLDALGRKPPQSEDQGIRTRAILNFGAVDTAPAGITPHLNGIRVVTANSEYTVADVTDCDLRLRPGDTLDFSVSYSAMIQSFLSPYVRVSVIDREIP